MEVEIVVLDHGKPLSIEPAVSSRLDRTRASDDRIGAVEERVGNRRDMIADLVALLVHKNLIDMAALQKLSPDHNIENAANSGSVWAG